MIVVKIGDGMGNQLFNYACGYAAARREHDSLKLDTSEADNSTLRSFMLDRFQLSYDARETFPNKNVFQKLYKRLRRNLRYRGIKERDVHAVDRRVFEKKKLRDKYLHGYWQHLAYFEEYLGEITAMMKPAYEQSAQVQELIRSFQTQGTCAVHVRGGDITGPGAAFFGRALARMDRERPGLRYLIFTNDRKKADEALGKLWSGRDMAYISGLGTFSDVDEFFLMAACRNQIISNSSFSTWAAYLNPAPDKVVIMPEYKGCGQMRLKEWIVL